MDINVLSQLHNKDTKKKTNIFYFFSVLVKNTEDLNNPALKGSSDVYLGLSTTMAMTREREGKKVRFDRFGKERKKGQTDKNKNKGKIVIGDQVN